MLSSRGAKPLVSIFLSLLLVLAFVLPFLQYNFLAGPLTPFDKVQAGAIRFGIVLAIALVWLGVQLFWKAPSEATKLGMAASATIVWLALVFFFNFTEETVGFGGAMAFFVLMGGLGVTLMWTRFLADEINF
ncbi:MAG TPA: hypothetical protein VFS83_16900 [Ktedonobacterales bacterium]|jgi:hypothetical protein|nr:hypothetical protein [Ktedonobacterales bacterium]HEX5549070.1 hypothetical protein [Ktedonobacterales bacterium]